MRRLLEQAGLTAPVFQSNIIENQFLATYLLHQLLGEDQLLWLKQFNHLNLSNDEAKALILANETGAIDNASLRAITGLDTLSASQILSRLHHQYHLLTKGGAGPATYYQLSNQWAKTNELSLFAANDANTGDLHPNTGDLPEELKKRISALSPKARRENLWPVIIWLCALRPMRAEQLAQHLNRQVNALKANHLNVLRNEEELICYTHPEVINHPEQAYQATNKGREWLKQQGIMLHD